MVGGLRQSVGEVFAQQPFHAVEMRQKVLLERANVSRASIGAGQLDKSRRNRRGVRVSHGAGLP